MPEKRILAVDMGASSGRAMAASYDGSRLKLEELHRFDIRPVKLCGTLCHDVLGFFEEIKKGITLASSAGGFESMGIDTWGCDFGLLDKTGRLLSPPVHYRDDRTISAMSDFFAANSRHELYGLTGLQHLRFNTLFQLYSFRENPEILKAAGKLLMMPDLLTYFLTGRMASEFTVCSTTQLLNPYSKKWSAEVLEKAGLSPELFCEVVPSGTLAGMISRDICRELGVGSANVYHTAGHDTAAAFAAAPAGENEVYISSGTWSIMGIYTKDPIVNDISYKYNFANEGAADGGFRFLKNIAGLWLVQECRREWGCSFSALDREAVREKPFACFIDPDDDRFIPPGDMPEKIKGYCRDTGQYVPTTRGEIVRCVYESLAMKYREVFGQLRVSSGRQFGGICIVGGGVQAAALSQFTANACKVGVIAGPIEATALGNVAVQLVASGELESLAEAKELIARSFERKEYIPEQSAGWDTAYERFSQIVRKKRA